MGSCLKRHKRKEEEEDAERDPVLQLTDRERFIMWGCEWHFIYNNFFNSSIEFLIKYVEKYPEMKNLFLIFKSIENRNLIKTEEFQAKAVNIMYHLNEIFLNMDDIEFLRREIRHLRSIHYNVHLPEDGYKDFFNLYFSFLQKKHVFPDDMCKRTWRRFMDRMIELLSSPVDLLEESENESVSST